MNADGAMSPETTHISLSWVDDLGHPDSIDFDLPTRDARDLIARGFRDPQGHSRREAFSSVCTTQAGEHCAFCPRDTLADCIADLPDGGEG